MGTMSDRVRRPLGAFWFPDVPLERVALVRIVMAAFALLDVAFVSNYMWQYTRTDERFYRPVHLLDWLSVPPPSVAAYAVVYVVMITALLASVVGYRTRIALAVAAPLYLYHWSLFNSWGKVNHGKIPVVIALFVLAVAPSAQRLSVDAARRARSRMANASLWTDEQQRRVAGWALRFVGVVVVTAYAISVLAKLRNTGLDWPVQPIVEKRLAPSSTPLAEFVLARPVLLNLGQTAVLMAETLAFLAFFGGWRRNIVLGVLAAFHVGSYVLLETDFSGFLVAYVVFFPLERALVRIPGVAKAPHGAPTGPRVGRPRLSVARPAGRKGDRPKGEVRVRG